MTIIDWKEAAHFVGAYVRGGQWEVGLDVAKFVDPTGKGGPRTDQNSSVRVSLREFSEEAGLTQNTIAKYLATWEHAADAGVVAHYADLDPEDEYDWENSGLTKEDWDTHYRAAVVLPPPWGKPDAKPLEPRKGPERHIGKEHLTPSPEAVAEAIKADPEIAVAASKALNEKWADEDEKVTTTPTPTPPTPESMDDWVTMTSKFEAAKRNLSDVLGLAMNIRGFAKKHGQVEATLERVGEVRNILDAIEGLAQGESIDEGLARLLEEGAV